MEVFVAKHCKPCDEIVKLLKEGKFLINDEEGEIDLIDIESEDGFKRVIPALTCVPMAFRSGKECKLKVDDNEKIVIVECPSEENP